MAPQLKRRLTSVTLAASSIAGEEVCGGDARSDAKRRRARHAAATAKMKRSKRVTESPAGGDDDDEYDDDDDDEIGCFLCEKLVQEKPKTFKSQVFHSACHNALRSWRRLQADLPAADKFMRENQALWRHEVLPLVREDRERPRDGAARQLVKKKVENTKVSSHMRASDKLLLTKSRFRGYMKMWERMDRRTADAEFERLLKVQNGVWSMGRIERVAVDDNTKVRTAEGTEFRVAEETAVDAAGPSAGSAGTLGDGIDDEHGRRGRPRTRGEHGGRHGRSDSRRRRRKALSASSNSLDDDDDDKQDSATQSDCPSSKVPGARRSQTPPAHRPKALTESALKRHERDTNSLADARSIAAGSLAAERGTHAKKLTPVQFIKEKSDYQKRIADTVGRMKSQKGVVKRLEAAVARLEPGQSAELDSDPKVILDLLSERLKKLQVVSTGLDKLKVGEWHAAKAGVEDALADIEANAAQAEAELLAVSFLVSKAAKKHKALRNAVRYRRDRCGNRLAAGGFGKELAKFLSPAVESSDAKTLGGCEVQRNVAADAFSVHKVALWEPQSEAGKPICELMTTCVAASIEDRKNSLAECLRENEKWSGAMARVDADMKAFSDMALFGDIPGLTEKGTEPWLVANRCWQYRFGPNSWPMCGMGCLVSACTDAVEHWAVVVPADQVLSRGICLNDVGAFLNTPSGLEVLEKQGLFLELSMGHTLWVPWGYLVLPICVDKPSPDKGNEKEKEAEKDKQDKDKDADRLGDKAKDKVKDKDCDTVKALGFFLSFTPFVPSMVQQVGHDTWKAIKVMNTEHMSKVSGKSAWAARARLLEKFCTSVAEFENSEKTT